jgi:hypothetical protein
MNTDLCLNCDLFGLKVIDEIEYAFCLKHNCRISYLAYMNQINSEKCYIPLEDLK